MNKLNCRLFRVFWFVLTGSLLLTGCDFSDTKTNKADSFLRSPRYQSLSDSIRQFPDDATLYAQRALLLSQNNQHELATADYKKAWELDPNEGMANQYVNNLMLVNKPREAVDFLKECIATWPQNTELRRRLGEIYEQSGQQVRALQQYDDMLQQDSTNFEAWYNKGILLSKMKDTAGAIHALERSYAAQPIFHNGITLAGFYATTLNPKTPALCDDLIAKDLSGTIPDAHFVKGLYFSYTKQYDSAMAMFNECIRRDWRFSDAHVEKGVVHFEKQEYDEALKTLKTAVTVSPTNPDAYYWMARCYEETGDTGKALLNYQRALAIDPTYDDAREGIRRVGG